MPTTEIREEGGNGVRSRESFMQEGGLKSERNLARGRWEGQHTRQGTRRGNGEEAWQRGRLGHSVWSMKLATS